MWDQTGLTAPPRGAQAHLGGGVILIKYAGKDTTAAFDAAGHPAYITALLGLGHLRVGSYVRCVSVLRGAGRRKVGLAFIPSFHPPSFFCRRCFDGPAM
jgi:hypothetical protein